MDGQDKGKEKAGGSPLMMGILVVAILVAGGLGYVAWKQIEAGKPVPIGDILADLRTYDGRVVHVEGEVSAPNNIGVKWFTITDETGSIAVVTDRGLPTAGTTIEVDGQVDELFNLMGISMTVIKELPERQ